MANLIKQVCTWTGVGATGGGVSVFYFDESHVGGTTDLKAFFTSVATGIPSGTTITVPNTGDLIDVASGNISGTWTDGTAGTIACSGSGAWAAGVGCRIVWSTDGVTHNRRVKGSTFLVPLTAANYQTDGTILDTTRSSLNTAATTLFTASDPEMKIYTRPVGGNGGKASTVKGAVVPDKVSWLRSRRT